MKEENAKDLNLIMKASGSTGAGRLADIFFRYSTNIVLTRILGAEAFGIFILGRTMVMVLSMIGNLGMGLGLVKQIAYYAAQKDEDNVQQSIRIALIVPGIASIITALLLFFGGDYVALAFFKKPALALPLKLLVFSIPVMTLLQILLEALRGFKKINLRVMVEYYFFPLVDLLLVVVFFLLGYRLEGAILAFMTANFLSLFIVIFLNRNRIKLTGPGPLFKKDAAVSFFKFSLPLTFVYIFTELKLRLDILFLGWLSTAANTSIFFIALRMASFLALPSQASHMIFAPMVSGFYARDEIDKIEYNYKNLTRMMFIGSMFLMGFLAVFSRELLSLFGAEFEKGMPVLILIGLGQLVKTLAGNAGIILVMVGKPTLNLVVMIVTVVLLAVLDILLIPGLGIVGAGIANLTVVTVTGLMELHFVYRYLHIHPFRRDFFKPVLAAAVGMGVTLLLKKVLAGHVVTIIGAMLVFASLYAAVLYLLGFSEEEKALIAKIKQKIWRWKN